jgi:hypothetical protein
VQDWFTEVQATHLIILCIIMKCGSSFVHYKEISFILSPSKSLLFLSISVYSPERRIKANRISIWSTLVIVNSIIVRSALSPYRQRDSFTVEPIFLKWLNLITFCIIQIIEAVFKLNSSTCAICFLYKSYF